MLVDGSMNECSKCHALAFSIRPSAQDKRNANYYYAVYPPVVKQPFNGPFLQIIQCASIC